MAGLDQSWALAVEAPLAADSHVSAALPTANFGGSQALNVGGGAVGLLRFDLATLPAGTTAAKVSKASLVVYVNRVGVPGAVEVQTVYSPWSEAAVTAATAPTVAGAGTGPTAPVVLAAQCVTVDVTAQVKAWLNGTPNNSFALTPALPAPGTTVFLDSKEGTGTGRPARLDIALMEQGPSGPQGPAGPQGLCRAAGAHRGARSFGSARARWRAGVHGCHRRYRRLSGKKSRVHQQIVPIKDIWLYPLRRNFAATHCA